MKLTIVIKQPGRNPRVITTPLTSDTALLETLRKLWEVEQTLNSLPGADLRVHVSVE